MKVILLAFLAFFYFPGLNGQVYPALAPPGDLQQDGFDKYAPMLPLDAHGVIRPANYNVGHSTDFTVRVKQKGTNTWHNLYEYTTFVNSNPGEGVGECTASSFVSFNFAGTATIEITWANPTTDVLVRPISRHVVPAFSNGNTTITFDITGTSQYSVEINGDRYRNLQVFANSNPALPNAAPGHYNLVFEPGVSMYDTAYNGQPKTILIKSGAVVTVPVNSNNYADDNAAIVLSSYDEVFIEDGGILKGGIVGRNIHDVKIEGNGIIDLTNFPKRYNDPITDYSYIKPLNFYACSNITIAGLILSDSQHFCIAPLECDHVTIDNVKAFSRTGWGDGVHMQGTSNVTINNCFFRTSDDGIAIYCSRHSAWDTYLYHDAHNISVANTILYTDKARPIEIGVHGNGRLPGDSGPPKSLRIYNLLFEDIDVLEHDDLWESATGVIAVNCGDNNICSNFLFRNIHIEDFTNGRLFAIRVEAKGSPDVMESGKSVSDIRIENITYNGSGERPSSIQGIDYDHPVDGVHFYNLIINGTPINKASDYSVNGKPMFALQPAAYNITFQKPEAYDGNKAPGKYERE